MFLKYFINIYLPIVSISLHYSINCSINFILFMHADEQNLSLSNNTRNVWLLIGGIVGGVIAVFVIVTIAVIVVVVLLIHIRKKGNCYLLDL